MVGEVGFEEYNKLWWELCEKYQGVMVLVVCDVDVFDLGVKYYVLVNVFYMCYFFVYIL